MFYMQNKGRGKTAKVVNFVAKWLNLCLSTVSDEECSCYESFHVAGICAGKHFTEGGLLKFIDEAAKLARQGGMYETVNEVYKATLPVAEANRNFEKLAEVHKEISDAFQEIIRLQVKAC